jgi:acyl transferase domain-containing protein/NAD(P)-dependent dehydrogenase (short-subunit alcohol dehydrogenase family)
MSKVKNKETQRKDIAIVGMSALFPKAPGLKDFWKVLRLGVDTIGDVPETHWNPEDYFDADKGAPDKTYCRRGGFLEPYPFDPTEFSMPPTVLEATDTSQLLGLVAAKAALEDAGYGPDREFDREQTSIILGVTGTLELVVPLGARLGHPMWRRALKESGLNDEIAEEVMSRIAADYVPWQENSFPGLLGNVVAGRIANRLDLHGTNCVVDAACASTLSAAHLAFLELQAGQADMVITGGTDTFNDIFMYMCFSKTPALSPSGKIRPFDASSDGTLIGEGLGMVVFKRLADAERDGDRIYAVVRGVGTSSDGKDKAVYAPFSPGQARALRRAYSNAEVSPRTVELVEAHGTGTKVGDVVEFEALKGVYAEVSEDRHWCALGTVKSQIGHTKAAAGSAGLIKAALALHHKVLPPTINIERPNPKLGIEESAFYLNTQARPWLSHPDHPRRAGLSSFGFGGSNFHLVLEEHASVRGEPAWDGSVELAAFSSDSKDGLAQALKAVLDDGRPLAAMLWESRQKFDSTMGHRLLIPALAEEMRDKLEATLKALGAGVEPEFYGSGSVEGKLGYVFPGQGSQYVGMGRELSCVFPEFLESLEHTGRDIAHAIYPLPVYSKDEESEQQAFLTATDRAQPALGVVERGYFHLLKRFGLAPDATAGHSYGELSALYAAGMIDEAGLATLSRERGRLMAGQGDDLGTMMAVKGSIEEVERVLKESGTKAVLANKNSPEQCVLSGSAEELQALLPALKKAKLRGIPLKVGAAFHSSFVAGARNPFLKVANEVKFGKASVPVYANKTAGLYPKAAKACRTLLADQLVHQVNWVDLVEAMYADGVRTFVEVGPKTVLSGLVGSILKGRDVKVVALDRSAGKKDSLLDFATGLAELAAHGCLVGLKAWELEPKAERKRRMTIPICGANYRSSQPKKPPVRKPGSVTEQTARPAVPAAAVARPASVSQSVSSRPTPKAPAARPASAQPAASLASSSGPIARPPAAQPTPVAQIHDLQGLLPHFEALQELSRQTAQVHQQFLKGQEAAQSALGQLLAHSQGASRPLAAPVSKVAPPVSRPAAKPAPVAAQPVVRTSVPAPRPVAATPAPVPVRPVPAAKPVPTPTVASTGSKQVSESLLKVVADKTGYPQEMLTLDMDLEADLGIDSIKRVEILAAVEEAIPGLPKVDSDRLGSLRSLGEIVEAMTPTGGLVAPAAATQATATGSSGGEVSIALLTVVADKTGYPQEMLTLDMDLEADLGIDSIKRVEILAAVEEAIPGLPKVDSDRLGSLRSLGEIVDAMTPAGGPAVSVAPAPAAESRGGTVSAALLTVVAEKTGYPQEMLSLDMDLEADLGIDSIKRVEILAAVEEALPGLPKVDSDRLGSLRSLGEIVQAMTPVGGLTTNSAPTIASAPTLTAAPVGVASGGEAVSAALLAVVAEKTGYPLEMLNLDMDLEADLGIDSIKRVEILASVEEALPELPKVDSDRLGSLRSLGEIVDAMTPVGGVSAPPIVRSAGAGPEVSGALLAVVAEKTGYPLEMLNLDMDLEADLGIDSIKRVEILASVEEALPELPKVDSDRLGSLRTLGEIVAAMTPLGVPAVPTPVPIVAQSGGDVSGALLAVVAEKTGYPIEMLSLEMDLEADLGIDSIKRVEILATVEEALPHLPKVDSDKLGSLRTLGEIVQAMTPIGGQVVASVGPEISAPSVSVGHSQISRQTLQLVDIGPGQVSGLPLPEEKTLVVLEDTPGLGKKLVKSLTARGVRVRLLKLTEGLPQDLGGLVLVGNGGDTQRSREFLLTAFQKTREAAPLLRTCRGSLFTLTSLDGFFGLKGKGFDPFVGGLAGIPKTVAHEWPEVFCRAIDWAKDVPLDVLADELMKDGPVEVALSKGLRQTLATVAAATTPGTPFLSSKDVVLVTGGARGVTAACVQALAQAYKSHFVLLGRTPLEDDSFYLYPGIEDEAALKRAIMEREFGGKAKPKELGAVARKVLSQREIRGTLARLQEAGSEALYLAGDVRDEVQMKNHIATVKKSFGKITSLIHGAGVLADRKIEEKTDEQFQQVFSTKIDSLVLLMRLLPDLKSMVFFSSVTARFGRPGQIDYCMANEVLNKFAQAESRRRPRCKVVAMGWGPWDGGMVTPALAREFQRIGVGLIPLAAGAKAVVDEFSHHGAVQAEVLFGDGFPEPPTGSKVGQTQGDDAVGEMLLQKTLSLDALPFLESHKIAGLPVLPMAFMQEWFVQGALQTAAGLRLIGVKDLKVFKGARIADGVEPTLTVSVQSHQTGQHGEQNLTLELRDVSRNILHARAVVVVGDAHPERPPSQQLNGLASSRYAHSPQDIYSLLLFHGDDFHAVQSVDGISDRGLVAELKVAGKPAVWEKNPLRSDWATEPLVVDGVLQLGILWCWEKLGKPSLPNGFARYHQYVRRFPKTSVKAALRVVSHTDRTLVADCELSDADGRTVALFEGLQWTADDSLKAAFGRTGALATRS